MDVIFVDDDRAAAERFARLVSAQTGLRALATDDISEAVDAVGSGQVLVAVLDQRLDGLRLSKGTELLAEMRQANPELRAVMLSGQADASDYQEAIRVQFNAFVDKNDIGRLSETVREQYDESLVAIAQSRSLHAQPLGEYHHGFSWRGPAVRFQLLGIDDVVGPGAEPALPTAWRTVAKVNAGETTTVAIKRAVEREVVVEREELAKSATGLSLRIEVLGELSQRIEVSARDRVQVTEKDTVEASITRTYALEAQTHAGRVVRARDFQTAPVYRRRRAVVRVTCDCCGAAQLLRVPVLSWTGRLATRQIDYYSDNTTEHFPTGFLEDA